MGQRDLVTNKCLSDEERYSDLINAVVFDGERRIRSKDLYGLLDFTDIPENR